MRKLVVIVVNRGPEIYVHTKRGGWRRRDTSDVDWSRFPNAEAARRNLPECPPWATNLRCALHSFME